MNRRFPRALFVFLFLTMFAAPVLTTTPGCGECDLRIDTDELPDGYVGESYFVQMDAHCGGDSWFLESGLLPPGIELREEGDLRGRPTRPGEYFFTIGVINYYGSDNDPDNDLAYKGFSMRVRPAPGP